MYLDELECVGKIALLDDTTQKRWTILVQKAKKSYFRNFSKHGVTLVLIAHKHQYYWYSFYLQL